MGSVIVKDLVKYYKKYSNKHKFLTLKSAFLSRTLFTDLKSEDVFEALKGVSFELKKGKTLSVIGENGSGKSTLLKILAGISKPSGGEVLTSGRISALIELGAGFHPEISGRENIFINGSILGLSKKKIEEKLDDIIKEAQALADLGHKELVITGVNVGTYQSEKYTIVDVVNAVQKIDKVERIRISSIEPTTIPKQLIYKIAESEKMCKHLHIPLQSGDDKILDSMRRKHNIKEFTDFVDFVYKTVPEVGMGTDVMVGFPGEGRNEFVNTKKILADLPISYFHVFTYSDREGTSSIKMSDKVDYHEKKERTRILIEQGKRKKLAFYEDFIGKKKKVLFEQRNKSGSWTGYTSNYMSVEVPSEKELHNDILEVELIENRGETILGKII